MGEQARVLQALVERELANVRDDRVIGHVRSLLVPPKPEARPWDYGEAGQTFECWIVLAHTASGTAIAYCDEGFGPKTPWGLLWLDSEGIKASMGMDSGWFRTFIDAFFESFASAELPIWRVVEGSPPRLHFLSDEMSLEEASAKAEALSLSYPKRRVWVHHSVRYR